MKKIMFTGGGSAGHVSVNLALIPHFLETGWSVAYIGSKNGIEKQLISSISNVKYLGISTGKLRRYFSWQNVKDPFKVFKGAVQAYRLIKSEQPNVLFSKGGFVSVPVVLGAWLNKVPIIIHESDITPGLANRLAIPFATGICTTFPETEQHLKKNKTYYVGAVIREELKQGSAERGRFFCQFTKNKPVLLIMGGSLGARKINQVVRAALSKLAPNFQIVHLCGKGQVDSTIQSNQYRQYEYINQELPDVLAMSDIIISRAGSNSIFEFLSLCKPMLLIPLTKEQSRGDQLLNARSFKDSGFSEILYEEQLSVEKLVNVTMSLFKNRQIYIQNMINIEQKDALSHVLGLIKQVARP